MLFKNKKVFDSIDQTIGNTPMVRLNRIKKHFNVSGNILAKLEFFNPLGSVKDRIGAAMIDDAEKRGLMNKETTIIEATSGNTGIALALAYGSGRVEAVAATIFIRIYTLFVPFILGLLSYSFQKDLRFAK